MQAGAGLLAVGRSAAAVLRWFPSHDLVAQPRGTKPFRAGLRTA
jgi:hypothetical protein